MFLDVKRNGNGMDYAITESIKKIAMVIMRMIITLIGIVLNVINVPTHMEITYPHQRNKPFAIVMNMNTTNI